jgi:hypothetical protein
MGGLHHHRYAIQQTTSWLQSPTPLPRDLRCGTGLQLMRQPRAADEPIFVNRYGVPLGASGVRFKLAQYVEAAAKIMPSLGLEACNTS